MMLLIPASELITRLRAEREKRAVRPRPIPPARH
jgi:hypothetical protein